jgi:hypothetical protein
MNGIEAGEANGIECNDGSKLSGCARCIARGVYGGNGGFAVGDTVFGNG